MGDLNDFLARLNDPAPKDCVGCGFCCTQAKCDAANRLYPGADHCPQLIWNGERHNCGLMMAPEPLGSNYRKELYAGAGCCSGLNDWRYQTLIDRTKKEISVNNPIPPIMQKLLCAMASQFMSGDIILLTLYHLKGLLIKDGMSEDEAENIFIRCHQYMKSHRSSRFEEFMG